MNFDRTYQAHGVTFGYPGHWELTEEPRDDAITVSVGDSGAFWSITVLRSRPRAERVLEEAIQAFKDEYEDVDEYPVEAAMAGESAIGRNIEFVALELVNCVFMRTLEIGGRTFFVMAQVTDHEREQFEPIFDAITASVQPEADDQVLLQ
ncbi:hypothetical protein [Planctomicrobium sp. SH527]|uniref:hypothetical protein n=1 Tax=Planctomicrobium sp. SH527 TaxID=3448123 RepID=UPI003F5BB97F